MLRNFIPALLLAGAISLPATSLLVTPAMAQSAKTDRVNVRGSVIGLTGDALKVKSREGNVVDVMIAAEAKVSGVARAQVTDIKPGDYVGIASLPKAEGGDGALAILIFPPALKGTGEGNFGWDLKPNSSMTNATVADAVKGVDGRTVTVSYHGKDKKIAIPDGTPVVTLAPATKADLVSGAVVFIAAAKDGKGALTAQQVVVGANGVVPPL
ncbi:hypothetical protein DWF00_19795 [Bosea caraganae]|uniref:DUF5666 domain-containing protein n=1 Tax=Bosea caraganae TaxID=2763117 RepID=A0A370KYH5_9HYPH|nr:hypothetical protein [Bosea caraganae]RDJ19662.1 hypothetical protein DWE98_28630 [Bosea caraganae]RDJ24320.1 hypothetical protein DWF00_19795 [Bosea caraganae]